jgi:hypothetical protein
MEIRVLENARGWVGERTASGRVRMPCGDLPNTAKAAASRCEMFLQNVDHLLVAQVTKAYDASANTTLSVCTARSHRGRAIYKLRFPKRPKVCRTGAAVHSSAFHEHACSYVVTAPDIIEEVEEEILTLSAVP